MEANEERRCKYLEEIKDIKKDKLVYIDESGMDRTIAKDRGWGKRSEKLLGKKSGKYYQRTNIIAAYVDRKPIAPLIFSGTCNAKFFEAWVDH